MNRFSDRMRAAALLGGFLATLAWAAPCLAEEGKCECPAKKTTTGIPIFAKVPYVNRLFKNAGCEAGACEKEDFQRIGIDFQILGEGEFPFAVKFWESGTACEGGQCKAKACCEASQCQVDIAACECPGTKVICPSCPVAAKTSCASGTKCACDTNCACDTKCACGEACQCSGDHVVRHPLGPVPFVAQHLPPQVVVAHHGPAHPPVPACPAMFEHLLELTAKSAALEAKLEARAEQAELVEEMLELAAENAKLRATVELAEARAEMHQHVLQVTLENEQLKAKLVELTSKLEADAARTARQPQTQAPR